MTLRTSAVAVALALAGVCGPEPAFAAQTAAQTDPEPYIASFGDERAEAVGAALCGPEGYHDWDNPNGPTCERYGWRADLGRYIPCDEPGPSPYVCANEVDQSAVDLAVAAEIEWKNGAGGDLVRTGWGAVLVDLCGRPFTTFTVAGRQYDCTRDSAGRWTIREEGR